MKPPPTHGLVNRLVALTLVLLMFSGSLGLGAVWVRQEISQAANRSRTLEGRLADVERRLDEVNAEVAAAVNPGALLQQNQVMHLGLATPIETQVVRVDISVEDRLAGKNNNRIFTLDSAPALSGDVPAFRVLTASLH